MKKIVVTLLLMSIVAFIACRKDAELNEQGTPAMPTQGRVVFNMDSVPYTTLSHYQFFQGLMSDQMPSDGVLPYEPINSLFSDYAHKKRFVWMPPGVHATYSTDSTVLEFPEGTVLIKTFYYDHVLPFNNRQLLETRLLYKKNGEWDFADYTWNADQTEAVFSLAGSNVPLIWQDAQDVPHCESFRIPAEAECHTCHKLSDQNAPIGPKPQNLNSVYYYDDGPMNQLAKWESAGYLASGWPTNINTVVKWDDATQTLTDRVRAYVDINCAHCHSNGRHCDYRPMRFGWNATTNLANMGVCVIPQDMFDQSLSYIVAAGNPNRSMMYYRMNTAAEAVRMPLLGRTVIHTEAVQLVHDWITSLGPPCQ